MGIEFEAQKEPPRAPRPVRSNESQRKIFSKDEPVAKRQGNGSISLSDLKTPPISKKDKPKRPMSEDAQGLRDALKKTLEKKEG